MPRIIRTVTEISPRVGTSYPAPFDAPCLTRRKHALGDAAGLNNFGVNYTILPPGAMSAQRHWHRLADEFIMVMHGELVLITDEGETLLTGGMCAGFPAGEQNGHHLLNRSTAEAAYLEIGDRLPGDSGEYPDLDMKFDFTSALSIFMHKDGSPYPVKSR